MVKLKKEQVKKAWELYSDYQDYVVKNINDDIKHKKYVKFKDYCNDLIPKSDFTEFSVFHDAICLSNWVNGTPEDCIAILKILKFEVK